MGNPYQKSCRGSMSDNLFEEYINNIPGVLPVPEFRIVSWEEHEYISSIYVVVEADWNDITIEASGLYHTKWSDAEIMDVICREIMKAIDKLSQE